MKVCFKCGQWKPLAGFYTHSRMGDRHLNKCKECTKNDVRQARLDPIKRERIRAYDRVRQYSPERREQILEYQRNRRRRFPDKYYARTLIGNAVRDGYVKRQPCEVCGEAKSQAHHDDYSKPFDIRWLCFKHHRELEHGQIVGPIQ